MILLFFPKLGIYYKPGSLMAKLCVEGLKSTYKFCDRYEIPYKKCGKLVVATNQIEVERLENLWERAQQNQVPDIEMLESQEEIQKYEPHCRGIKAIRSPHTGDELLDKMTFKKKEIF